MSEYCKAEVGEDCISRANLIESFLADSECKREEAKACMCSLDLMLELIDDAPSVIPQVPNEDAISRDYVKGICEDMLDEEMLGHMLGYIEEAPSVMPKEKEGEWIDKGWKGDWQFETDGRGNCWRVFECSVCNGEDIRKTRFCPHCRAKMKNAYDYERAIEQVKHDALYEPTYNSEDGSMQKE